MRKRNLYMSTTIMCGLFVVAFAFENGKITWFWTEEKPLAVILGLVAILLGTQWLKQQRLLNRGKQN